MINTSELMTDPDFVQRVQLKTQSIITVDFEPISVVTSRSILASVQPAKMEDLNADQIDWSRAYKMVHSLQPMDFGQFIQWKGKDYKVIQINDYEDNGFYEVFAEETKLPLLAVFVPDNVVTHNGEVVTFNGEPVTYNPNIVTFNGQPVTHNGQFVTYTP